MEVMCQALRGRKSKSLDKVREKRANEEETCGKEETSHLSKLQQFGGKREKMRERKRKRRKERRIEKE